VFQPSDNSPCLTVNRVTGVIKLESSKDVSFHSLDHTDRVYGILGLLSLMASDFIVILVGRKLKGEIFGNHVYQATDFKVLPLASSLYQHPAESHLLAFVRSHLFGGTFLFSYTWDLTRTLQAQRLSRERDAEKALWEVADDRFFWNKFIQSRFIDITNNAASQDLGQFILPVIYGTFDICDATIRSHNFRFALVSRRSRYRAGTRYFTRGIDEKGNVANFNETEQIVILQSSSGNSSVLCFVQIRGSIPLFWTEVNNLRYIPDLQIMEFPATLSVLRIHLQNQIDKYGALHIINLVKQKGREKPIKDTLEHYISQANMPHVSYDYFDFNRECRNMQWHRIKTLIDRVQGELTVKGYFHDNSGSSEPLKLQHGVFRTNCMDNLDRTNVVQSSLAKWTLTQQFRELGILKTTEDIDQFDEFMMRFRNIWADHADSISRAYSGTGALKTDFTRTGKRTIQGLLQDGFNSIMRYIKNNYFDGARQDAFDIFTGSWVPQTGPALIQTLLVDNRPLHVRSIPYILSFSIFMVFAGLTLPRTSDYSLVYYFSIWLALIVFSLGYIFLHGIYYVAWPRLNPPTEAIYYNGPGFRSSRRGFGWLIKQGGMAPVHRVKLEEVEMGNIKKRID